MIAFDADRQGRMCAARVDLARYTATVDLADLAPHRDDGYDLSDWLNQHSGRGRALLDQLYALRRMRIAGTTSRSSS